ncbi:MAG: hypothetical protein WBG92_25035 [Thiohalocapsa sp.]
MRPANKRERAYPVRREAIAEAFHTGVYRMQEIADYLRVHYATVSRAVHWVEARGRAESPPSDNPSSGTA